MNRLRTLAGIALIAGMFAGLSSCANKKGDLGAELDSPPAMVAAESSRRSLLDVTSPAEIPDADTVELPDPKNRTPQSVSINRDASINALVQKAQSEKKDGSNKGVSQADLHLPDAVEGEVVAIAGAQPKAVPPNVEKSVTAPVVVSALAQPHAPAAKDVKLAVDVKDNVKPAPKDGISSEAPTSDEKKSDSAPSAAAPVVPLVPVVNDVKTATDAKVEVAPAANGAVESKDAKIEAIIAALKQDEKPAENVAVKPVVNEQPADAASAEKNSAALALLNKQADEAARALSAKPAPAALEMRIYDVSDLTQNTQSVRVPENQNGSAEIGAAKVVAATDTKLAELIKAQIGAKAWDSVTGASIESKFGKIVVTQNPENQKLIEKMIADLRASRKVAVNVDAPLAPKNATQLADDDKNKEKTPPKPETPPVEETAEQRTTRLMNEAAKMSAIQRAASTQEAEAMYQAGLRLVKDFEYEKAKTYFEKAVSIDPTHELALENLRTVKSLLNIDSGVGNMLRNLADAERVQMQERAIQLAHYMEEARSFETRGSETVMDGNSANKIVSISERLRFLEQAQDRYRQMIEIINWMPPAAELPGLKRQADEALTRVRGKIDKYNEEVRYNNRQIALDAAGKLRTRDTELQKIRINKMLEHVNALLDIRDYKGAEQMALRVLINDPLNQDAEKLKKKARSLAHDNERVEFKELYRNEYRSAMQDNEQATISFAPLIQYPANWDQISKRAEVSIGRKIQEEPWKAEIRKKLQRKVQLDFQDMSLVDVIGQLRSLSNVTMILDPKVIAAAPPPINLRVPDMNLDVALDWILKLAELEYVLQDHAIYIGKAQTLAAPLEMRIYDVSDLTQTISDFPGPEFQIEVGATKGQGGGGGILPFGGGAKTQPPTNATIQEMIKTRIMPQSWDPATGASIEEKGGKLVVMQRPEIHKLIEQLLSNFRSTQKMMINIESRFLTIREAYLEQTGVEYQGLDPNVLFGDFGDLRRLGAPTGFLQPRTPGSTDSSPPNIPFPGIVSPPSKTNGGLLSTVGSIVNHSINFFPNDPDTISAQDSTNTVRQGGFSGQVTILNNTQMQAFIRAMAVRENSSTLIAPRLTVFNTQRASMFVARQQSYVSDYEISGDSYDPVVRQFLVGVVLDVKPIVSSDRRYVTLELRPTVTDLTNFVTRQIDTFTVNTGAQVNVLVLLSFPIQFPELSIQKVRTTATVPDGGIMLIGGLYKNIKFNAENGVPFLSDLPVVGRLFRWNVVDNAKSNLAILISPRIILFNEEEEKLLH